MELSLMVLSGSRRAGMQIAIPRRPFFIGRDDNCHLRPQSPFVSRRHCVLLRRGGRLLVQDLGISNGTIVNDHRIDGIKELVHGDRLGVGPLLFQICFEQLAQDPLAGTKPMPATSEEPGQEPC